MGGRRRSGEGLTQARLTLTVAATYRLDFKVREEMHVLPRPFKPLCDHVRMARAPPAGRDPSTVVARRYGRAERTELKQ